MREHVEETTSRVGHRSHRNNYGRARQLARGGLAVLLGGVVACGGYLWLVRAGAESTALAEEGEESLRTVVVDAEGLFLLYDAAVPEGQEGSPAEYEKNDEC